MLADGRSIAFNIDAHRKRALLLGLDDVGAVLADDVADIAAFEARQRQEAPWLHLSPDALSCFDDLGKGEGV